MLLLALVPTVLAGDPAPGGVNPSPDPPSESAPPTPIGSVVVDARVPAEILVDGKPVVEVFVPARVELAVPIGDHTLTAVVGANPVDVPIHVADSPDKRAMVMVGRTGSTVRTEDVPAGDSLPVEVQLRVAGGGAVQLRVDDQRWTLESGKSLSVDLPPGNHPTTLRSRDGTVIWATGTLSLVGGDTVLVQLSEGRLPEVSGNGSYFAAGG